MENIYEFYDINSQQYHFAFMFKGKIIIPMSSYTFCVI